MSETPELNSSPILGLSMKLKRIKFISYRCPRRVSNVKETRTKPSGNSGNSRKEALVDQDIGSNGNQVLFLFISKQCKNPQNLQNKRKIYFFF